MEPLKVISSRTRRGYNRLAEFADSRRRGAASGRRLHVALEGEDDHQLDEESDPNLWLIRVPKAQSGGNIVFEEAYENALRHALLAVGWHFVDANGEDGEFLRLGLMKQPVTVVLTSGDDFEAEYLPPQSAKELAHTIATAGTWHYQEDRSVYVPPSQIARIELRVVQQ